MNHQEGDPDEPGLSPMNKGDGEACWTAEEQKTGQDGAEHDEKPFFIQGKRDGRGRVWMAITGSEQPAVQWEREIYIHLSIHSLLASQLMSWQECRLLLC